MTALGMLGRKRLLISASGKPFELSQRQLQFDAPSLLSDAFESIYPSSPNEVLYLDINAELFAIIVDYLNGYTVLPLPVSAIPKTMTAENALTNLARDVDFLQLRGLSDQVNALIKREQDQVELSHKAYLRNVAGGPLLRMLSMEAVARQDRFDQDVTNLWLRTTLFVAHNIQSQPETFRFFTDWHHDDDGTNPFIHTTWGFRLPPVFFTKLRNVSSVPFTDLAWYYSANAHIEINGQLVDRKIWAAFIQSMRHSNDFRYTAGSSSQSVIDARQTVSNLFRQTITAVVEDFGYDAAHQTIEESEDLGSGALATEVRFMLVPTNHSAMDGPDTSHTAWVYSAKLVSAPELAKADWKLDCLSV